MAVNWRQTLRKTFVFFESLLAKRRNIILFESVQLLQKRESAVLYRLLLTKGTANPG